MSYQRKTRDRWDIMTNYGYGWECENSEYTKADARRSLKEYRENCGGSVRLEKHREPVENYEETPHLTRESAGNYYIELNGSGVRGSHGFETLHFYNISRGLGMSDIVLNFNERELTLLSDSILTMIDNAGQAKRLVCDTASQKAIDTHMKELQILNSKLCTTGIR